MDENETTTPTEIPAEVVQEIANDEVVVIPEVATAEEATAIIAETPEGTVIQDDGFGTYHN